MAKKKKVAKRTRRDPTLAPPFVQISGGSDGLYGLDSEGRVWRYVGECVWHRLNNYAEMR